MFSKQQFCSSKSSIGLDLGHVVDHLNSFSSTVRRKLSPFCSVDQLGKRRSVFHHITVGPITVMLFMMNWMLVLMTILMLVLMMVLMVMVLVVMVLMFVLMMVLMVMVFMLVLMMVLMVMVFMLVWMVNIIMVLLVMERLDDLLNHVTVLDI